MGRLRAWRDPHPGPPPQAGEGKLSFGEHRVGTQAMQPAHTAYLGRWPPNQPATKKVHSLSRLRERAGGGGAACPNDYQTAILRCRTGAPAVRLSAASMMALASMP